MFPFNICEKEYKAKKSLIRHQRLLHNVVTCQLGKNLPCLFSLSEECLNLACVSIESLRQHCIEKHGYEECEEQLTFNDMSGNYVPKGCGKHQIKSPESCKSGKICLASIEVFITSNSIIVKYHKNHCGHDLSLAHIHLSDSEKAVIAGKLANGVTLQRILDDIRDSASNELSRIHLVTRKDLQNIKCAYNLQEKKKYHPEDKISVQLWVDKMKSLEQSPVLYFKQQGEVDAQQKLGNEDFILIIMLPIQQELLKMLGQQMICVDSTHGTTAYDFYLSTILTVDEFGSGLPCAYCLSNRIDTTSYSLFFAAVREKLGKLETTVFMSDDASAIYNAWKDIMGPATHQLLCTWHVDRAWRKKVLSSFPDKVTQALMYKMLRVLLEEPNPEKFENLIKEFIQSLNQKETKEFQKYFVHTYASRPKVWAYCYRKGLGINTNMYLEAMHRVLKLVIWKVK
ncbi:uncharacterized protein [Centruroides vittatus]|uniref:uncharacterized protein n=1 Tax=Centruroides vittatus TaxID=120091 RepID=UPI00350F4B43